MDEEDEKHFDPFLVTAVPTAVLSREVRSDQESIHQRIVSWRAVWARMPPDLHDGQFASEITIIRVGFAPIYESVAGATHVLDVVRVISGLACQLEGYHALDEIFLYGVLLVACYVTEDANEVRTTGR